MSVHHSAAITASLLGDMFEWFAGPLEKHLYACLQYAERIFEPGPLPMETHASQHPQSASTMLDRPQRSSRGGLSGRPELQEMPCE